MICIVLVFHTIIFGFFPTSPVATYTLSGWIARAVISSLWPLAYFNSPAPKKDYVLLSEFSTIPIAAAE